MKFLFFKLNGGDFAITLFSLFIIFIIVDMTKSQPFNLKLIVDIWENLLIEYLNFLKKSWSKYYGNLINFISQSIN
jgi:hypothetical protein